MDKLRTKQRVLSPPVSYPIGTSTFGILNLG